MPEDDVGDITLDDLEEQETVDKYGRTLNPGLIPQDMVQADYVWYDPEKDEKGLVTKNMSLSFLEEHDLQWVYMTVDLINILDTITSSLLVQYVDEGMPPETANKKLASLKDARNDIRLELDTLLTAKRALKGRTAILSRTARHQLDQSTRNTTMQDQQKKEKKGLRKLWPL